MPQGFGGMLAFAVAGDSAMLDRFVSNLRVITSAVSLGHDESLVVHVGSSGPRAAHWPQQFRTSGHLRLSFGIKDASDLMADLAAALDTTFATA